MCKKRYIGGDLEINPLTFNHKSCEILLEQYYLFSSGRAALKRLLNEINPESPVLLPSYLCGSLLQPFIELDIPYTFYQVNYRFNIDTELLTKKLNTKNYSLILCIDYFGFVNTELFNVIRRVAGDLTVVEDCTHLSLVPALLGEYNYRGDYIFGSLRKTLPVPDGGFILKNKSIALSPPSSHFSEFCSLKYIAKTMRYLYIHSGHNDTVMEQFYMKQLQNSELLLDSEIETCGMSDISRLLLVHMDFRSVFLLRRENYKHLLGLFNNTPRIADYVFIPFNAIYDFDMPYMFPIFVLRVSRNSVRNKMAEKNIYTSIIWNLPQQLQNVDNEESIRVSETILCLPIDQRYNIDDINYLFDLFCACLEETIREESR